MNLAASINTVIRFGRMKPAQFSQALATLGWSQAEFARRTGVTDVTVSRWANGRTIPPWVPEYLRVLLLAKEMLG
ncbi:helix-turn-helix domain-containing protein [Burkholderia ubonensis]|nr:helix-turn-helix domain-containing protein [Burkholderia ubonensis]